MMMMHKEFFVSSCAGSAYSSLHVYLKAMDLQIMFFFK